MKIAIVEAYVTLTGSMRPTIFENDRALGSENQCSFFELAVGEVDVVRPLAVVKRTSEERANRYVKRVLGAPGGVA